MNSHAASISARLVGDEVAEAVQREHAQQPHDAVLQPGCVGGRGRRRICGGHAQQPRLAAASWRHPACTGQPVGWVFSVSPQ